MLTKNLTTLTIIRLLLKAGAAVDLPRSDGATALFKACHKGHREVVKQLLMHNPDMGLLKVTPWCVSNGVPF